MDIGKPIRIHNIPDPNERKVRRVEWERENPYLEPEEQPIRIDNWPTKKPVEVETDG